MTDLSQTRNSTSNPGVRVLLWSPSGSGEHYSGPASFTYRLFKDASKDDLQLSLVHGNPEQKQYELFDKQVFLRDYKKSSMDQVKYIRDGKRWLSQWSSEYDVMHSISGYHTSMAPSFYAEKLGLPSVVFVSNHHEQLGVSGGWRNFIGLHKQRQRMARSITGFVAMSSAIREELLSYKVPERRIADIPMGVNTDVFKPAQSDQIKGALRQKLMLKDIPTLLFSGTLVKRKRPDLLVEALVELKRQRVECQLVLCGPETDAIYVEEMKQRAIEAGINNRIKWIGFCIDVSDYYRAADFFCLPSSNEGMSASLVEAMASGVVPIVTPVSGSADLVIDGTNGSYVTADANVIADTIKTYINHPELAKLHGASALELIRERYTDKVVYDQYIKLYDRVKNGQDACL